MTGPCGVILAGGRSLRYSGTGGQPKALAPLAGAPMLLHVAAGLVLGGAGRIVVLTGPDHDRLRAGLGLGPGGRGRLEIALATGARRAAPFELRYSGETTGSAGRLRALRPDEIAPLALLSYTDILTDAPLGGLLAACRAGAALALLAVHPVLPWGMLTLDADSRVTGFDEKPRDTARWINGGVMALTPEVTARVADAGEMLEGPVMRRLLDAGLVRAVRHRGAWRAVDSPKDRMAAAAELDAGGAAWKRWNALRLTPL